MWQTKFFRGGSYRMKKNVLWLIMIVLVFSTVLAGCGSNNAGGSNANTPAKEEENNSGSNAAVEVENFTVSLRHTQLGESKENRLKILEDSVAAAEAAVPGLKFELEGVDSDINRKEKLRAEMAAGNPPKIFDLFGGADTHLYATEGKLLELTAILEELGIKDQFIELGEFTVDGGIYGLPIGGFQEGYFYNKVVFDELGLTAPTTWEELENVAAAVKEAGKVPFAQASKAAWVPLMAANTLWSRYAGPEITSGFASGETKWNSPEMVAAFTKYQEWVNDGYFKEGELGLEYAEQRNQLITGEAAMMYDGSWASSVFNDPEQAGDLVGQTGYFAMPPVPDGVGDQTAVNAGFSNGYGFSADLNENELKAVKAFIGATYNQEMQLRGVLEDNLLPSMKLDSLEGVDPLLAAIIEVGNNANSAFPAFDALVQPEVNLALSDGIQQIIGGVIEPQEMLDNVQVVQEEANSNAE
jgi:raffinose/stachyose/melibiose transport system substrate-binding protein